MDPAFLSGYAHAVKKAVRWMSLSLNMQIFDPLPVYVYVPWEPVVGEKCPHCEGYGHDDGGPGPWRCNMCDGTGTVQPTYERPSNLVVGDPKQDPHYKRVLAAIERIEAKENA